MATGLARAGLVRGLPDEGCTGSHVNEAQCTVRGLAQVLGLNVPMYVLLHDDTATCRKSVGYKSIKLRDGNV